MQGRWFIFILAVSALAADVGNPDDVILNTGEVIEGKVDRAATDAANKGKTNPNDMVLVLVTDEAGARKTVKRNDIKYIMSKKTSWEVRKDNLAWYQANKDKQKDTAAGMENWARQCSSRKLNDEAQAAFKRAYFHRSEALKAKDPRTAEDHLMLAKWCRKFGLSIEESNENRAAVEIKRKELAKDSTTQTKNLLDLAGWCRKSDLEDEAISIYEDVLKADPENVAAKAAIKQIGDAATARMKGVVDQYIAAGRAWKIRVAIEDAASPKVMEEWKERLESLSTFIFRVTEGQFFVYEWTLEDQTSNGQIIVDRGKLDWEGMNGKSAAGVLAYCKGSGTPHWEVHCPGRTWESVLCHEMFHGIFGLLDEYYQRPQCPCIMRAAPNPQKICNPTTHLGGGNQKEPCWNTIKRRFKDVLSPNPSWTVTKEGIKGKGPAPAEEVEGELTIQGKKVSRAPLCRVVIIDK